MTREMIEETYSLAELKQKRKKLMDMLLNPSLTEEEKWDINDLIDTINKRIRFMNDLLIELPSGH